MPLWRTPCSDGGRPVISVARFGMQIAQVT
jgi:hypothetical protein